MFNEGIAQNSEHHYKTLPSNVPILMASNANDLIEL